MDSTPIVDPDVTAAVQSMEQEKELVRFQYDGSLEIEFKYDGLDLWGVDCDDCVMDDGTSCSSHVTPLQEKFTFELLLKYNLQEGDSPLYCDIVRDDLLVQVSNEVGVDKDYASYAPQIKVNTTRKMLELCSKDYSGSCDFAVEHTLINGKKTNAKMEPRDENGDLLYFLTGRPNLDYPHTKLLRLDVNDGSPRRHTAKVIVTGDFVQAPGPSFALPTYKPLLILRDPPGGLSTASYQNVETTVKLKSQTYQAVAGFDGGLDAGLGGDVNIELCSGGGVGAIVLGCATTVKTAFSVKGNAELGGDLTTDHWEKKHTAQFTSTWSYTTSDNPFEAGRLSDVMVVPNLNVEYHEVVNIGYDNDNCTVLKETEVKFDINDVKNKPAFSFLSIRNIEESQIKKLNESAILLEDEYERDYVIHNKTNETFVSQIDALRDGLKGWTQALEAYEETNANAAAGGLVLAPQDWFKDWVSNFDKGEDEPTIADHWASLIPETLSDKAVPLNGVPGTPRPKTLFGAVGDIVASSRKPNAHRSVRFLHTIMGYAH
jgi:hypothetical protein